MEVFPRMPGRRAKLLIRGEKEFYLGLRDGLAKVGQEGVDLRVMVVSLCNWRDVQGVGRENGHAATRCWRRSVF
jgi:hypothetical protein